MINTLPAGDLYTAQVGLGGSSPSREVTLTWVFSFCLFSNLFVPTVLVTRITHIHWEIRMTKKEVSIKVRWILWRDSIEANCFLKNAISLGPGKAAVKDWGGTNYKNGEGFCSPLGLHKWFLNSYSILKKSSCREDIGLGDGTFQTADSHSKGGPGPVPRDRWMTLCVCGQGENKQLRYIGVFVIPNFTWRFLLIDQLTTLNCVRQWSFYCYCPHSYR